MTKRAWVEAFKEKETITPHRIFVREKEFIFTDIELAMFPDSVLTIQFNSGIPCNDSYDADPVLFEKYIVPMFHGTLASLDGIPTSEIRCLLEMMDYFHIIMDSKVPGIRALRMCTLMTMVKEQNEVQKEEEFKTYFQEHIHSKLYPVGDLFAIYVWPGSIKILNQEVVRNQCKANNIYWNKNGIFSRLPQDLYERLVEQVRAVVLAEHEITVDNHSQPWSTTMVDHVIPPPNKNPEYPMGWGKMECNSCYELDKIIEHFWATEGLHLKYNVGGDMQLYFYLK